ncbi:MAG TPA: hypothetical protein VGG91_10495 [Myxococcaceae bacterium]
MTRLAALVLASSLLVAPSVALACSVCGCGDPMVLAGDSMPVANTVRFALEYEYLTATARSDDDPERTESLTQMTLRPVVVYSPFSRVNLVLQIPVVRKDWALSATGAGGAETATPIGLGDVDLGVRVFLWDATSIRLERRQNLALTGGTSFPTGADDRTTADGERIDQHAQLGTGAWGPYVGALYAFHQDPWNFLLSVTGRFRTTNSYGYRFGDAVLWSAQLRFRIVEPFALQLGVDGRYAGRDRSGGVMQANTGGLVVSAVPGIAWNVAGPMWLLAQVQIPFLTHLFGEQTIGVTATAGLQFVLN